MAQNFEKRRYSVPHKGVLEKICTPIYPWTPINLLKKYHNLCILSVTWTARELLPAPSYPPSFSALPASSCPSPCRGSDFSAADCASYPPDSDCGSVGAAFPDSGSASGFFSSSSCAAAVPGSRNGNGNDGTTAPTGRAAWTAPCSPGMTSCRSLPPPGRAPPALQPFSHRPAMLKREIFFTLYASVADPGIRDPRSGAFSTPGSGMEKNQDPDRGSEIGDGKVRIREKTSRIRNTAFWKPLRINQSINYRCVVYASNKTTEHLSYSCDIAVSFIPRRHKTQIHSSYLAVGPNYWF